MVEDGEEMVRREGEGEGRERDYERDGEEMVRREGRREGEGGGDQVSSMVQSNKREAA